MVAEKDLFIQSVVLSEQRLTSLYYGKPKGKASKAKISLKINH